MRYKSLFPKVLICIFGIFAGLLPFTSAAASTPLEQAQLFACRATSSLLLLRGEGFQAGHRKRFDTDLAALETALQSTPEPSSALREAHKELVTQLRNGVSFGHKEEDVPWRYPQALSKSLRDFLFAAYSQAPSTGPDQLAIQVEYLAVQYLYRSYMGSFETAREHSDQYLGQDERRLVPTIDAQMAQLDDKSDPVISKLKTRWGYLKNALADMNSQSSTLISTSGRPFAPITVDRHTRSFSSQWLALTH